LSNYSLGRWCYPRKKHARYVAKLSRWEKDILMKLWFWEADFDKWIETHPGDSQLQTVKRIREAGMDWQPRRLRNQFDARRPWTPSDCARVSRAWHRLEARGLIERILFDNSHRTRLVRFTPRGRKVAKQRTGAH
jgi:hypothetical protein